MFENENLETILKEIDLDGDGNIDFDEFVSMMLPATMMSPESQINAGPA